MNDMREAHSRGTNFPQCCSADEPEVHKQQAGGTGDILHRKLCSLCIAVSALLEIGGERVHSSTRL